MSDIESLKVLIASIEESHRRNKAVVEQARKEADAAYDRLAAAEDTDLRMINALNAMKVVLRNLSSERNMGNKG